MPYDIFISYSRRDNENGQVAALKAQIEKSFLAFAGRELSTFFDTSEIQGMDDWRHKIQRSLRDSQLFLAVLSPPYLSSPYCRWEWEDYVRYEAMRQCLGEGVAPVFFVTLPSAADLKNDQAIARWVDEIQHRQTFDLCPWHGLGEKALEKAHVKTTLEQLHASVRERLDRAGRARRSPNNLLKHNPAFVGRVRELTELRNALTKNKLGVVGARSAPSRVAVQGLGGMGKTELALAYAHAFAWDYPGGRWQVACEHTDDLRLALTRLAGPMHFEFTEDEKKDLAMQFDRVLRELAARERSLLILDNVSDPALLEPEHLDRLPRDGHLDLIATTRLAPAQIPGSAQDQSFIAVDELPEEDALALMRSHQPEGRFATETEDDEARKIVHLLRGFTLAVETAAIYLGRHPDADACRSFRERLSPDLLRESEEAASDPTVAVRHRVRSLEETLAFTLKTLTPEALRLLQIASLLPADQVAVPWLLALGAEHVSAFKDAAGAASEVFRAPMEDLLGLRLLQASGVMDADGRPLVVRMHRLVQELIRGKQPPDEVSSQEQAVDALVVERDAALEQTTRWEEARWELAPLTALAGVWDETNYAQAAWLMNQVGQRWKYLAEWSQAESLMRRALAILETSLGENHPNVAASLNNLAGLLQATNRLTEAEPLLMRVVEILANKGGEPLANFAGALNNLAGLLQATSRLVEAEPLYRRALGMDEASYGPDHPAVARDLSNLAGLLQATNRLAEAEPLMRRALGIDEARYGPDHPQVAINLNNLARLLHDTNRLAEAEPLVRRALGIDEASYGPDHPNVAIRLNNLALLLKATDRLAEAEPLYRRAFRIFVVSMGLEHPNSQTIGGNYIALLETLGLGETEIQQRVLAILIK